MSRMCGGGDPPGVDRRIDRRSCLGEWADLVMWSVISGAGVMGR